MTFLVLFDLSAAFDTIDHGILLERLHSYFGISGVALSWFSSYLKNRQLFISINGAMSKNFPVKYGVPHGSCLGPLLFVLYVSKLFEIVESHLPEVHAYADDTQLYVSFKPDSENQLSAIEAMQKCIADIRRWMLADPLNP